MPMLLLHAKHIIYRKAVMCNGTNNRTWTFEQHTAEAPQIADGTSPIGATRHAKTVRFVHQPSTRLCHQSRTAVTTVTASTSPLITTSTRPTHQLLRPT